MYLQACRIEFPHITGQQGHDEGLLLCRYLIGTALTEEHVSLYSAIFVVDEWNHIGFLPPCPAPAKGKPPTGGRWQGSRCRDSEKLTRCRWLYGVWAEDTVVFVLIFLQIAEWLTLRGCMESPHLCSLIVKVS